MGVRLQQALQLPFFLRQAVRLELPDAPPVFGVRSAPSARRVSRWSALSALWKKLPQFWNLFQYRHDAGHDGEVLNYDPIHLQITTTDSSVDFSASPFPPRVSSEERAPNDEALSARHSINPENFRFLLEQVPAIRTIAFTGPSEPLRNAHLIDLVEIAYRFNHAESTVYTDGSLLDAWIERILKSSLVCLVVQLYGTKPSQYSRLSGKPARDFIPVHNALLRLIARKRELNVPLTIDISLTVDLHNFHEIPDMIAFAEALGVDGLRLENYLSPQPERPSDRTLYTHQTGVVNFLKKLKQDVLPAVSGLQVALPVLLDINMSNYRYCRDPFTTVAVDADFTITGCSRHLPYPGPAAKIWDSDFWNHDMYQWLRHIHSTPVNGAMAPAIPAMCQSCPLNMPRPR